jgi:hypothetical protein
MITRSLNGKRGRSSARMGVLLLALLASAAMTASTAGAQRPLERSFELPEITSSDAHLSAACGVDVSASFSGVYEEKLFRGKDGAVDHQVDSFDGRVTWSTEGGNAYSSEINSKMTVEYPDGFDLFDPARVTVTGRNGGIVLIGGTPPPGSGTLVFDGFVFSIDEEGFALWAVEGDPIEASGNFEQMTERICAALT